MTDSGKQKRDEKRRQALKANLKRRKQQTKSLSAGEGSAMKLRMRGLRREDNKEQ